MAQPLARQRPCQNRPSTSKDEPAGPSPIKGSDTYTPALTMSCVLTPAPLAAPALAPAALDLTVRYSEANLQRILWTVPETKPPAPASQPLVFPDSPCKRPLKARFPELYCDKTHMECYNFIQQCKDHFATARAKDPNCVPFAATFVQEQALFCWQQYMAKNVGKTDAAFTWEKFEAFFCQSLGESWAFVDNIWRIIRRDF